MEVTNDSLRIVWTSGLVERERVYKPCNLLRAVRDPDRDRVVRVHVLTTPDSNGDSEYKEYDLSHFQTADGPDSFEAAVNAVAFAHRPLVGRCLVFINPISGTKAGPKRFKSVHHLFHLVGLEFDAVTTTRHGHASEVVATMDLSRYCAIISVSGDGTLQEIFTALLTRPDRDKAVRKPVGCIPAGSEGTLAKISTFFNPLAAAFVILKRHEIRPLDVLDVLHDAQHTYCVCGVGWGIPGKIAEDSESLRGMYGKSRYAVSALREFVNLKGCRGSLHVMPAREKPLCYCGPRCLRCKGAAEVAERQRAVEQEEAQVSGSSCGNGRHLEGSTGLPGERGGDVGRSGGVGGGGGGGGTKQLNSNVPVHGDEELVFEDGKCEQCGHSFELVKEGKVMSCPYCVAASAAGGGAVGSKDAVGGAAAQQGDREGEGVGAGRGDGDVDVVRLDYNSRLQGRGDTSDRGSGLLKLADEWRREEEAAATAMAKAQGKVTGINKSHAEGVWQQLDGEFIAIGGLNTERISAPYAHMSDGCMDVIAVPAHVSRIDLLQMGFDLPTGGHLEDKRIFHWKATQMKFAPVDSNDKFNVDGEVLEGLPIHIKVLPALARIISHLEDPAKQEGGGGYFF